MKPKQLCVLLIAFTFFGCITRKPVQFNTDVYLRGAIVRIDTLTLKDSSTGRIIPIAIYNRDHLENVKNMLHQNVSKKLVILNPGYGGTRNDYGYIANNLAVNGYLVVTIQHDLPTDDSLPHTGDIYKSRKPIWDRGVKSILYTTNWLKKEYPKLDYKNTVLIGHSNGGDMAMLIANEYTRFAKTVITLDNRRVPVPRSKQPKILSIRSSDQPADPGVLPSEEEQRKYHIKIVRVNIIHDDMGGAATADQKKEINDYIMDFLSE